jgi:hypothetical protein
MTNWKQRNLLSRAHVRIALHQIDPLTSRSDPCYFADMTDATTRAMPSALPPSEAELAKWRALSRQEQLARYRDVAACRSVPCAITPLRRSISMDKPIARGQTCRKTIAAPLRALTCLLTSAVVLAWPACAPAARASDSAAVEIRNGPMPGALELRAHGTVELSSELIVEQQRDDGSFERVQHPSSWRRATGGPAHA